MTQPDNNTDVTVQAACVPTVERLQLTLDGELPASALESDPHLAACATCRQRIAAARLVLSPAARARAVLAHHRRDPGGHE